MGMESNQLSFPFIWTQTVTHAINSKSPGFVSTDSAPTISTTYSSFSRACFPKVIYHTLPETGQHETGENSDLQRDNRQW